jgi:multisubunit Na+/H+ antiporter MnhB subunit
MDDYYLENAQQERSVNNVVTSIVFDYRGFDTLGEAAVLFTAVCSVLALFRKGSEGK